MAKKHKHPEHVNHERWLISYADFITLLFAFFVVMFSVSQTDSNKVGRYSESFVEAMGVHVLQGSMGVFDGTNSPFSMMAKAGVKYISNEKTKLGQIEIQMQALQALVDSAPNQKSAQAAMAAFSAGTQEARLILAMGNGRSDQEGAGKGKPKGDGGDGDGAKAGGRDAATPHDAASAAPSGKDGRGDRETGNRASGTEGPGKGSGGDGDKGLKKGAEPTEPPPIGFRILRRRSELVLRLDIDVLFNSGADELDPRALSLLEALGRELKDKPVLVKVEGHADNRPIHTTRFPSNWHLSSARATAVVLVLMEKAGVPPSRLAASGLGEHQPLASNDTEAGRAKNRRVDIVIGLDPVYADSEEATAAAKTAAATAEAAARPMDKKNEDRGTKPAKGAETHH